MADEQASSDALALSPSRRRAHTGAFDDGELLAITERCVRRTMEAAQRQLSMRERQLKHDREVFAKSRARRPEEGRTRVW